MDCLAELIIICFETMNRPTAAKTNHEEEHDEAGTTEEGHIALNPFVVCFTVGETVASSRVIHCFDHHEHVFSVAGAHGHLTSVVRLVPVGQITRAVVA